MPLIIDVAIGLDLVAGIAGLFYTWLMSDVIKMLWRIKIEKLHHVDKKDIQDEVASLLGDDMHGK